MLKTIARLPRLRAAVLFVSVLALATACSSRNADHPSDAVRRTTFSYGGPDRSGLLLDLVVGGFLEAGEKQPVIIVLPQNAEQIGNRYPGALDQFVRHFSSHGYTIIAAQYAALGDDSSTQGSQWLEAIRGPGLPRRSVEDVFSATAFVLGRAEAWNVDPERIFVAGIGDGGTVALAAEYLLANQAPAARRLLPEDFRYAGVVSFGGRLPSRMAAERPWRNRPSPMMMFYGDAAETSEARPGTSHASPDPDAFYRLAVRNDYTFWAVEVSGDENAASIAPLLERSSHIAAFLQRASRTGPSLQVRNPLKVNRVTLSLRSARAGVMARMRPIP